MPGATRTARGPKSEASLKADPAPGEGAGAGGQGEMGLSTSVVLMSEDAAG